MGRHKKQMGGDSKPVVVVVGGGYAGVAIAKELDNTGRFGVVMVDRKDYFAHSIGSLRAVVREGYEQKVLIPFGNKFLHNGATLRAEITGVDDNSIYLDLGQSQQQTRYSPNFAGSKRRRLSSEESGSVEDEADEESNVTQSADALRYDYLVLATGSSYGAHGKPAFPKREMAVKAYQKSREAIAASSQIVIVGGGPVGCQLAAEIATAYNKTNKKHSNNNKRITIIQSQNELVEGPYSERFRTKAESTLRKMGVKIVLGERVDLEGVEAEMHKSGTNGYLVGKRVVRTNTKREVVADLVFYCTGAQQQEQAFYSDFLEDSINQEGRIKVNKYFQVRGHKNVFAIGDCCDMEQEQMAYLAQAHAVHAAKNIDILHQRAVILNHSKSSHSKSRKNYIPMQMYKPESYPGMILPLGPSNGVSQLPGNGEAAVLGSVFTRLVKGRDLLVGRTWNSLHQKPKHVRKHDKLIATLKRQQQQQQHHQPHSISELSDDESSTTSSFDGESLRAESDSTVRCRHLARKEANQVDKMKRRQLYQSTRSIEQLTLAAHVPREQAARWIEATSETCCSLEADSWQESHNTHTNENDEDDDPLTEDDDSDVDGDRESSTFDSSIDVSM